MNVVMFLPMKTWKQVLKVFMQLAMYARNTYARLLQQLVMVLLPDSMLLIV